MEFGLNLDFLQLELNLVLELDLLKKNVFGEKHWNQGNWRDHYKLIVNFRLCYPKSSLISKTIIIFKTFFFFSRIRSMCHFLCY